MREQLQHYNWGPERHGLAYSSVGKRHTPALSRIARDNGGFNGVSLEKVGEYSRKLNMGVQEYDSGTAWCSRV